uniref:Putative ovule protein n=1 Tax=Solanum chacoense TaxID=4108 RepID=A0A0V0IPD6_SOLCH
MAKDDNRRETGPKTRDEFTNEDIKAVQNNVKAKKVLICGFGPDEYSQSSCNNAKKYVIHCKLHMKECHDPRLPPRHDMVLRATSDPKLTT